MLTAGKVKAKDFFGFIPSFDFFQSAHNTHPPLPRFPAVDLYKLNDGSKDVGLRSDQDEYSFIPGPGHTYEAFFRSRWRHSNLLKYIGGFKGALELASHETDTTVNAQILLDALILTIPFGILPSLNFEYWDWLQAEFNKCDPDLYPEGWGPNSWFFGWAHKIDTWIAVTIFLEVGGIVLSCFYYSLRPTDDKKFRVWWITGKYLFYAINACSVAGVIMLLTVLSCLLVVFNSPSDRLCDTVTDNGTVKSDMQWIVLQACAVFVGTVVLGLILAI